jgi:hypothetical protein
MKHGSRSGSLWTRVDRIQSAPDMRKTVLNENPLKSRDDYELKNAYRL